MVVRDVPRVSAFDWHGEHQTSIKPTEDSAGEVSTQVVVTGNDMGPDKIKLPGSRNDAFQTADLAVDPSQRFRPATHSNPDANFDDEGSFRKKRPRGRPRLDIRDESTARDRRRAQIRLAQRAYRHRKDTAISSLENKVQSLRKANEALITGIEEFHSLFTSEGVFSFAPQLDFRVRSLLDNSMLALTGQDSSASSIVSQPMDQQGLFSLRDSATSSVPVPDAHLASPSCTVVTPSIPSASSFPFHTSTDRTFLPGVAHTVSYVPMTPLPSPATYCAHETTFGRRLQRANIERGLRLISMASPPPDRYAAVFGFCLFFESRDTIIHRLSQQVSRSREESLHYWHHPFTNLGGAGTFLPNMMSGISSGKYSVPEHRDLLIGNQHTREYGKPSMMTGFTMGPFSEDFEVARKEKLDHRMRMLSPGFEGDFFDPDEVETYLRHLGIVIPPAVDFVEAEINVEGLLDDFMPATIALSGEGTIFEDTSIPASTSDHLCLNSQATFESTSYNSLRLLHYRQQQFESRATAHMEATSSQSSRYPTDIYDDMGGCLGTPASDALWPPPATSSGIKVSIDVDALLNEMISKSVCLGRTPGVRRKDVNRAVIVAAGLASRQ